MINIKFKTIDDDYKTFDIENDKYLLLYYFMSTYRSEHGLPLLIKDLETIKDGKQTFADITQPNVMWSFGNDAGYFECDKETAYFKSFDEHHQSMEMPLKELIELLIEWKNFLEI